jgi:hypothetical protein
LEDIPGKHSIDSLGTSHTTRKLLQCETWSLSRGDHRWFKGSTRKNRPVTRDDIQIIIAISVWLEIYAWSKALWVLQEATCYNDTWGREFMNSGRNHNETQWHGNALWRRVRTEETSLWGGGERNEIIFTYTQICYQLVPWCFYLSYKKPDEWTLNTRSTYRTEYPIHFKCRKHASTTDVWIRGNTAHNFNTCNFLRSITMQF